MAFMTLVEWFAILGILWLSWWIARQIMSPLFDFDAWLAKELRGDLP